MEIAWKLPKPAIRHGRANDDKEGKIKTRAVPRRGETAVEIGEPEEERREKTVRTRERIGEEKHSWAWTHSKEIARAKVETKINHKGNHVKHNSKLLKWKTETAKTR